MDHTPELMTANQVAEMLKMSRSQVYDLTRSRARIRNHFPIPYLKINGNLRFRRSDIVRWLHDLASAKKKGL